MAQPTAPDPSSSSAAWVSAAVLGACLLAEGAAFVWGFGVEAWLQPGRLIWVFAVAVTQCVVGIVAASLGFRARRTGLGVAALAAVIWGLLAAGGLGFLLWCAGLGGLPQGV